MPSLCSFFGALCVGTDHVLRSVPGCRQDAKLWPDPHFVPEHLCQRELPFHNLGVRLLGGGDGHDHKWEQFPCLVLDTGRLACLNMFDRDMRSLPKPSCSSTCLSSGVQVLSHPTLIKPPEHCYSLLRAAPTQPLQRLAHAWNYQPTFSRRWTCAEPIYIKL